MRFWFKDPTERHSAPFKGRAIRPQDTRFLAKIWQDPQAAIHLSKSGAPWSNPRIKKACTRLSAHWQAHYFGPRIWFHRGHFIGYAGLKYALLNEQACVEIMWGISPKYQGRGWAQQIAALSLLEPLGFAHITAITLPDNHRSIRLMERLGFVYVDDCHHADLQHVRYLLSLTPESRAHLKQLVLDHANSV